MSEVIENKKEFESFLKKLKKQKSFVFNIETYSQDQFSEEAIGIGFFLDNKDFFFLPIKKKIPLELKPIFENKKIKKVGHNLKNSIKLLLKNSINIQNIYFDTELAAYLLGPGDKSYNLKKIASRKLQNYNLQELALAADSSPEEVANFSKNKLTVVQELTEIMESELEEANLLKLFRDVELPLVSVLAKIELNGIKVNAKTLERESKKITKKINNLSQKIFKLTGKDFNIDSPLQLRKILFEDLALKTVGIAKGKTGISTAAKELEKLKNDHPVINLILEYRELAKLKTTYLDALPKLIDLKTKRIHTSFNQTIASTGRLSSSSPNLQNIPTKKDFGQMVRKAFIAENKKILLAADYAHIELRIIASMSGDAAMIEAFSRKKDIHSETAAKIWDTDIKKVTPAMRRAAKAINFGIIYGMGARGLSQSAKVSFFEAKEFIRKYFEVYSGIKEYLYQTKEMAYDLGYVETIMGRRRYLPEIFSPVPMIKKEAERMAINMPVQGTAADLIKLAMIKINEDLLKISKESKMILQVHDELIFEVPQRDLKKVASFVKKEMEGVTSLEVPIIVEIKTGRSWGELKEYKIK